MARKPAGTQRDELSEVREEIPIDPDVHIFTADDLDPALEALMAEGGGDVRSRVKVYVSRVDVASGKEPRVWQGLPAEYDLMAIAKAHGSGDYKIRLYVPRAQGGNKIMQSFAESVELSPSDDARIAAIKRGETPVTEAVAHSAVAPLDPVRLASAIVEGLRPIIQPASAPDPFAQFQRMADAFKSFMPQQQQNGLGVRDVIEMAGTLAKMTGGGSRREEGAGDDPGDRALNRAIDMISGILEKGMQTPAVSAPLPASSAHAQPVAIQTPKGQTVQNQQPQQDADEQQKEDVEMMRLQLRKILRAAQGGIQVPDIAEQVFDKLPDALLLELAMNAQWMQVLIAMEPQAQQYVGWLTQLRDAVLNIAVDEGIFNRSPDGSLSLPPDSSTVGDDSIQGAEGNVAAIPGTAGGGGTTS